MAHPEDPEDPKEGANASDSDAAEASPPDPESAPDQASASASASQPVPAAPRPPSDVAIGESERFADDPEEEAAFKAEVRTVRRKILGGVTAGGLVSVLACWGVCIGYPCFTTGLKYGIWDDRCPTTDLRLGLEASANSLIRGGEGQLSVSTYARHLRGKGPHAYQQRDKMYRGFDLEPVLLGPDDEPVEGVRFEPFDGGNWTSNFEVHLPKDLTDGDYTLRVTATAPFETLTTDLAVPLYAPALAHVASDRPLYKPGQEVKLRSVLLKRTDLTPLEARPGKWEIRSPSGEKMLVEKDRAGTWGVADTTFPLDGRAEVGTWKAIYSSGGVSDEIGFDVRPFQLPRFAVKLAAQERWYGISDEIVIEGTATYTSGAPVADAPVEVTLSRTEGRWPMPLEWQEEPFTAKTDRFGDFSITVGEVPPDLIERAVISARARVTEEAGGVITGSTSVILSEDDLMAEAVTELGDGLVGGFNNRVYLRVSTPDGKPVGGAKVEVRPAFDPEAEPKTDTADVDGVAAIQLDPGDPVTVVIPAAPVRERPFEPDEPSLMGGAQVLSGASLSLAERKALDKAVPAVARCGDYAVGGRSVTLGLRVNGAGGVSRVLAGDQPVDACVARAMQSVRFPSGDDRTYSLRWNVTDTLRPWLTTSLRAAVGDTSIVDDAYDEAALQARRCMPFGTGQSGATVVEAHWSVSEDSRFIDARVTTEASASGLTPGQVACIGGAFARASLDDPAYADAMGTLAVRVNTPRRPGSTVSRPTTRTAYELAIAASIDGAELGDTNLVLNPGTIPAMRLRATPSIAKPGDEVIVDILRGPDWRGGLPEELWLMEGTATVAKAEVDQDNKRVTYQIPDDVEGFVHVDYGGARAVIFVQPANPLTVALSTDQAVYRPGEEAVLTVTTMLGETPTPAGVGLAGVDSTLGQLAPLLGPDAWGRVTVRAEADKPAFDAFDPKALTLGQVRGDNAAKAAVLRISQLPMDHAGDEAVYASNSAVQNDLEVLTRNFYRALVELHEATGAWEDEAAEDAILTNADMAKLWRGVLAEMEARGEPAVDAFGRPLELHILPRDLLEQCDPRQVVSDATHLPEDIEDWVAWVAEHGRDA